MDTVGQQAEETVLLSSEKHNMKNVYLQYASIAVIVIGFQTVLLLMDLHSVFQIAILAAFVICILYYTVKAVRDSKQDIALYNNRFEISGISYSYNEIIDLDVGKTRLVIKMKKPITIYADNIEALAKLIRRKRRESL